VFLAFLAFCYRKTPSISPFARPPDFPFKFLSWERLHPAFCLRLVQVFSQTSWMFLSVNLNLGRINQAPPQDYNILPDLRIATFTSCGTPVFFQSFLNRYRFCVSSLYEPILRYFWFLRSSYDKTTSFSPLAAFV